MKRSIFILANNSVPIEHVYDDINGLPSLIYRLCPKCDCNIELKSNPPNSYSEEDYYYICSCGWTDREDTKCN